MGGSEKQSIRGTLVFCPSSMEGWYALKERGWTAHHALQSVPSNHQAPLTEQ